MEACCGVSGIPVPVQILPEPGTPDYLEEAEGEGAEYGGENAGESQSPRVFTLKKPHQQEVLGEYPGEFAGEYDAYPFRRFGPPKFHRQPTSPVEPGDPNEQSEMDVPAQEEEEEEAQELFWHIATRMSETELREEDQEILEALMKLGEPGSDNDPIGIPNWMGHGRKKSGVKPSPGGSEEEYSDEDSEDR